MRDQLRQKVLDEASRFREWATDHAGPSGEWELDYGSWDAVLDAFTSFVGACSYETWNDEITQAILYLVARDNEAEFFVDVLAEAPDRLLLLAGAAIRYPESDARWQLADRLGDLREHMAEAESLLVHFAQDEDEYVRRRAVMALGRLGSRHVERLAQAAWNTGDEYQRMAILDALHALGSPKLREYLDRARVDGRHYLVSFARKIESDGPV